MHDINNMNVTIETIKMVSRYYDLIMIYRPFGGFHLFKKKEKKKFGFIVVRIFHFITCVYPSYAYKMYEMNEKRHTQRPIAN